MLLIEKGMDFNMPNIFIIGSKGIPAKYGGFETFVDNLTSRRIDQSIKYHIACMGERSEFIHNEAHCFSLQVPNIGSAKAVYYDLIAFNYCIDFIKKQSLKDVVIYILACRIGPFLGFYTSRLRELDIKLFVNPDGHEWKRSKWNWIVRKYWKISEKLMVKHADLLICDSKNIEDYIKADYKCFAPKTTYIAYGADLEKSVLADDSKYLLDWFGKYNIQSENYYLIVGRFVPENNYEIMIREFMNSKTLRDLVIITNSKGSKFYKKLKNDLNLENDKRIKFVGTVYDQKLLKKIREKAYAYIHGHEVGGTNPSLLEAMSSTKINLLIDVSFNREVGGEAAIYWKKNNGDLKCVIEKAEQLKEERILELNLKAQKRLKDFYSWTSICESYEKIFRV